MYILYDVENNVGIRTTNLESVQKVKEINPLIKEVMYLTGRNIGAIDWDKVMDMSSQFYIKWFKEKFLKTDNKIHSVKPKDIPDAKYLIGNNPKTQHITTIKLMDNLYMSWSYILSKPEDRESITPRITFEYFEDNSNVCISYNPNFGPIQYFKREENMESIGYHPILGEYTESSWAQCAVIETGLNEAVLNRDYSTIREILSKSY